MSDEFDEKKLEKRGLAMGFVLRFIESMDPIEMQAMFLKPDMAAPATFKMLRELWARQPENVLEQITSRAWQSDLDANFAGDDVDAEHVAQAFERASDALKFMARRMREVGKK